MPSLPFIFRSGRRRQRERSRLLSSNTVPTNQGGKALRAQFAEIALAGVYVPVTASWVSRLPAELLSFPAGQHDDEVDQGLPDAGLCPTQQMRPLTAV
jgi:phage terminase large subunit-like protein